MKTKLPRILLWCVIVGLSVFIVKAIGIQTTTLIKANNRNTQLQTQIITLERRLDQQTEKADFYENLCELEGYVRAVEDEDYNKELFISVILLELQKHVTFERYCELAAKRILGDIPTGEGE